MEVFNKFYTSVSSTVQQLSGVLPGNPVTREYEGTHFIATAGIGLLWKVFRGFKKSTKQEAAIFVFEKKQLDKWHKADRDMMIDILKHGIIQLTKIRHPLILTVQHGLEESRESLAFATEPVFSSLANILGNLENMTKPPPQLANFKLHDVEIKYGLMQVAEGLTFLHNDVKLLHRNICPESIILNEHGAWKIFGFDFCLIDQSPPGSPPYWPFTEYCRKTHYLAQPSLEYMAPENILTFNHSTACDIFSLGMLIYVIFNSEHQTLDNVGNDFMKFKKFAHDIRNLSMNRLMCVPPELRDYVKLMLHVTPELRPDLHQFIKTPYFDDVGVKTLNYLDSIFQWDNLQKSQFYKGLPQVMQKMPHRICIDRILTCLIKEFVNPPMIPFVLPNVILIAETATRDEYVKCILPSLKPLMLMTDPIQILLIFLQKIELLVKLTPGEDVKSDVLPMVYRSLELDSQYIQELCLSLLPTFVTFIDYQSMKNAILPRIKKLCLTTNVLSVRVNCLLTIGKLLDHLDKWLVLDEILPFLQQMATREPAVLMGTLGIYKLVLTHKKLGISKEILATKVLPFLIPISLENGLSLNQFNSLISVIKQMITVVETEQRAKLEQLHSIENESKKLQTSLTNTPTPTKANHDVDKLFAGLGVETYSFPKSKTPENNDGLPVFNNDGFSLTLEEKQRIASQQDNIRRFMHQQPLHAAPAHRKEAPIPVDLTSKLLESNLTQLSAKPFPTSISHIQPPVQTGMQLNTAHASVPSLHNYPMHGQQNRPMGFPEHNNMAANNQWQGNTGNFNNKWANQNNPSAKQDWSAFESLLPDQKPVTANNNNNKQDHNEMMDLLG